MALTICLIIITIAFVILVIFLCLLAQKIRTTLIKIDPISTDLKNKLEALQPFFHTASTVGEGLDEQLTAYKQKKELQDEIKALEEEEAELDEPLLLKSLEFIAMGILLWQNFARRNKIK